MHRQNVLLNRRRIWWGSEASLVVLLFVVGISLFFRVDQIPGNLGDARFNMYVLEHGYRWLRGLDNSFWSAPFYYPAPNVITYSDNHLGSLLFYSAFRVLGASRESAFQLWALTLFALNYFIAWLVLRMERFHPVGAIAAAYLFTFPFIMGFQNGHIQLAPRFMVPAAFSMASRFLEAGSGKYLRWLLAACAYQIYLGIYTGYFLVVSIGLFCLLLFLLRKQWNAVGAFFKSTERRVIVRRCCDYAVSCIGFVVVLLPLAIPYYRTQRAMGGRSWEEIVTMLPRWQSYLRAPTSYLWGRILHFGDRLPAVQEHALFLGALPYLAVVIFVYLCWKKRISPAQASVGFAMVGVVLLFAGVTFYWSGFSLYRFVWAHLPGAGGIRAVTRSMLVVIYPLAFIFAMLITILFKSIGTDWRSGFLGFGVLALTVVDQGVKVESVSKNECERRLANLEATIVQTKGNNVDRTVLWVNQRSEPNFIIQQLDAMLAGQDLNLKVVNGYSGLVPKDYPSAMFLLNADSCTALGIWARIRPGTITNHSLLQIGSRCEIPDGRP